MSKKIILMKRTCNLMKNKAFLQNYFLSSTDFFNTPSSFNKFLTFIMTYLEILSMDYISYLSKSHRHIKMAAEILNTISTFVIFSLLVSSEIHIKAQPQPCGLSYWDL